MSNQHLEGTIMPYGMALAIDTGPLLPVPGTTAPPARRAATGLRLAADPAPAAPVPTPADLSTSGAGS
ncbi:hypothetical protein ACH4FX_09815 [Streptomyces sp. NPDC018019]|uniref:hypothetical protein n=1 Tax=Streptomyces sp. NPDC018019 TaxID=3365030 RepID=UPI0037997F93